MSDRLAQARSVLAAGGMVVVTDDQDRENEADLVMAAAFATEAQITFFLRHGSGIVCVPMSESRADELDLPPMVADNCDPHRTAFTVTVDHIDTGSGISAHDRTATIRALADSRTTAAQLRRPGHVFPLRARAGGVLTRPGHTEAAVDLLTLAGLDEVGVITELVDDAGVPMTGPVSHRFAVEHGLVSISVAELAEHQRAATPAALSAPTAALQCTGRARLPLRGLDFIASTYRSGTGGPEQLCLTLGDVGGAGRRPEGVLTRLHSECLTGDVFGSARCDCGAQLGQAIDLIGAAGVGVIVYLRGHEGRGIGLGHKLRAYALQESGADTVDANTLLGLPVDARDYAVGAAILNDIGVRRVALITNNPDKWHGLAGHDLELAGRVSTGTFATPDNLGYLRTKRDRMGHDLADLPDLDVLAAGSRV